MPQSFALKLADWGPHEHVVGDCYQALSGTWSRVILFTHFLGYLFGQAEPECFSVFTIFSHSFSSFSVHRQQNSTASQQQLWSTISHTHLWRQACHCQSHKSGLGPLDEEISGSRPEDKWQPWCQPHASFWVVTLIYWAFSHAHCFGPISLKNWLHFSQKSEISPFKSQPFRWAWSGELLSNPSCPEPLQTSPLLCQGSVGIKMGWIEPNDFGIDTLRRVNIGVSRDQECQIF